MAAMGPDGLVNKGVYEVKMEGRQDREGKETEVVNLALSHRLLNRRHQ